MNAPLTEVERLLRDPALTAADREAVSRVLEARSATLTGRASRELPAEAWPALLALSVGINGGVAAGLGALVGLIFKRPGTGALIGLGVGAGYGVLNTIGVIFSSPATPEERTVLQQRATSK